MTKIIDKVLCALVPQPALQEIEEQDLWMDLEDYSIRCDQGDPIHLAL